MRRKISELIKRTRACLTDETKEAEILYSKEIKIII